MLGVTVFGIFFTPVFYSVIRKFTERTGTKPAVPPQPGAHAAIPVAADGDGHAAGTPERAAI
jgi:hypothetical protein